MSTKPTYSISGVTVSSFYGNNFSPKQDAMTPISKKVIPFKFENFKPGHIFKNKHILAAGYIDEDGYPRLFDPSYSLEDPFLAYSDASGFMIVEPSRVAIVDDPSDVIDVVDGMVCYHNSEKMKTTYRKYVQRVIEMYNGVMN